MAFELQRLCSDTALEEQGVWVDRDGTIVETSDPDEFEMRIASMRGKAYQHARYRSLLEHNVGSMAELDPDMAEQIQIELFAKHILKEWRHLEHKGTPIPYTTAAGQKFLRDQRSYFDLVTSIAMSSELFLARNVEGLAKNLLSASNGKVDLAAVAP